MVHHPHLYNGEALDEMQRDMDQLKESRAADVHPVYSGHRVVAVSYRRRRVPRVDESEVK